MKRRTLLGAIGVMGATSAALVSCGSNGDNDGPQAGGQQSGGTLTIGTISDAQSWDPALASAIHGLGYYQPLYDSLLRREPNGDIVPMLAKEWEENEDRTSVTFHLRDDVTFSDGERLDASAVKLNLERMQQGSGGASSRLDMVTAIEIPDDWTVVLELSQPNPNLLDFLAGNVGGFIASPAALEAGTIESEPVGSGPYTLDIENTTRGSQYAFNKREDYWAPDLQHFDSIVVRYLETGTPILNALLSGQVDVAQLTPKTAGPAVDAGMHEIRYMVNVQGLFLLDRNGELAPPLGDVRVRQAINHALDKEGMLEQVQLGYGEITSSPFGPQSTAGVDELDDYYPYDPERAKELLREAGYEAGFDIEVPTQAETDQALTASIETNLAEVGITVNWTTVPSNDYVASLTDGLYPMGWFSQAQQETWRACQTLVVPTANFNPMGVEDDQTSEYLTIIQNEPVGSEESNNAAQELNRYIVEQAWYAPTFRIETPFLTNDRITVEPQAMQAIPSLYYYKHR